MNDDAAIRNLIGEYVQAIDDGRIDDWAETMLEDVAIIEDGQVITPRAALVSLTTRFKRTHGGGAVLTRHFTTNTVVALDGDCARASSDLLIVEVDARGARVAAVGRYVDQIVRTEGGWRFKRREITLDGLSPARIAAKRRAALDAGVREPSDDVALEIEVR